MIVETFCDGSGKPKGVPGIFEWGSNGGLSLVNPHRCPECGVEIRLINGLFANHLKKVHLDRYL